MQETYVYILLTDTGSLLNKTIQKYTKAPYNHVSLSFDHQLNEMYSFGRKKPRNPFIGGFVKEDVLHGVYRVFPNTTCSLFRLKAKRKQIKKMKRIINLFEKNQRRYTYNLIGLLGVAMQEPYERNSSYFCSQFVSEVLFRSGLKLWKKKPSLVTPDDFRLHPDMELLYEGKLYDYEPVVQKLKKKSSQK